MESNGYSRRTESPAHTRAQGAGPSAARKARQWAVAVLICAGVLGTVLGVSGCIYLLNRATGVAACEVVVERGMSVSQIAHVLHGEGIIRSPQLLRLFSLLNGTSRRLTAGTHPFHGGMTTWRVLQELEAPRDATRVVTIPEGLRRERVARLLAEELGLDRERLLEVMSDRAFCREMGVAAETLEGYLFPETYEFSLLMDEAQVIRVMVRHFFRVFDDTLRARAKEVGMSVHEAVTLASIIEGGARLDGERALISAVYRNRLKRRMRLQADPTVQYAISDGPRRLFYEDYRINSPYNTYRYSGLPPGPIMNAGAASLKAALYPADEDYLYFVARGDGSHVFSRTMSEHEAAKRGTRRARRRSW